MSPYFGASSGIIDIKKKKSNKNLKKSNISLYNNIPDIIQY